MYRLPETKHLAYHIYRPALRRTLHFAGGWLMQPQKTIDPWYFELDLPWPLQAAEQTAIDKLLLEGRRIISLMVKQLCADTNSTRRTFTRMFSHEPIDRVREIISAVNEAEPDFTPKTTLEELAVLYVETTRHWLAIYEALRQPSAA